MSTLTMDLPVLEVSSSFEADSAPSDRVSQGNITMSGVVEMLLKNRAQLNRLLRNETYQRELVPILLIVAALGFTVYGVAATAILNGLHHANGFWFAHLPAAYW